MKLLPSKRDSDDSQSRVVEDTHVHCFKKDILDIVFDFCGSVSSIVGKDG